LFLTAERRFLRSGWLWVGVGASILVLLPNLIWQMRHHFISLEFLSYLRVRDLQRGRFDGFFREQLTVCVNLVTAPLALMGLWFYFLHEGGKRYRLLGWTFGVTLALFALRGSRSYYTAPLYPMLISGGSVLFGNLGSKLRPVWSRLAYRAQWTSIFASGVAVALLVLPVAPIGSPIWRITSKMHDQFREEIGWPELAHAVAGVYNALSPEEQARTGILAGNYGEAGALNLYGPALGLPHAMSLTNSFWYRGYDPQRTQTMILAGFGLQEGRRLYSSCEVVAKNTNPYAIENEESRDHPDILLCRNLRMPWPEYWQDYRRFG
jgi:hypothetical protein